MSTPAILAVCIGGAIVVFVGFYFLDEWHKQRAWRRAGEEANRIINSKKVKRDGN